MKPLDEELFAHVKKSLTEYEEPYVPGAWERFEKKEKKLPVWLWYGGLSSAAALFVIVAALFYSSDKPQNKAVQQQVKTEPKETYSDALADSRAQRPQVVTDRLKIKISENKKTTPRTTTHYPVNDPVEEYVVSQKPVGFAAPLNALNEKITTQNPSTILVTNKKDLTENVIKDEASAKRIIDEKDTVKVSKARNFQEFLDAEMKSKNAVASLKSGAKKMDKWEMGLMVAPSMGNAKKLNMGYGLSMDYAVSDKISISSGISYNEMAASKSIGGDGRTMDSPASMAVVSDTKSLKSVDANWVGVDIPLGIKYHLSKKFYTNVGVSAFAVLNQKQQNNYVQGSVEYDASADQLSSTGFKAVFQERTVSEPVPSEEVGEDKYLGFYNVSFGFKQQISGRKAFSIEPFMKLPMKSFTKENLYLIGTGVRFKFDF